MKKFVLLFTLTTLLASQAFGVALCPTVCESFKKEAVEDQASHCHQEKKSKETSNEMPIDCGVMALLKSLSTFNVSSYAIDVTKPDIVKDLVGVLTFDNPFKISVTKDATSIVFGKSPPIHKQPLYLLKQQFLI